MCVIVSNILVTHFDFQFALLPGRSKSAQGRYADAIEVLLTGRETHVDVELHRGLEAAIQECEDAARLAGVVLVSTTLGAGGGDLDSSVTGVNASKAAISVAETLLKYEWKEQLVIAI